MGVVHHQSRDTPVIQSEVICVILSKMARYQSGIDIHQARLRDPQVSIVQKIKSLFSPKSEGDVIFEETLVFRQSAFYFVMPLGLKYGGGKVTKWIVDEPQYAANYMLGFSSELTNHIGEKLWGSYTYITAWQIFRELSANDPTNISEADKQKILKPFLEYVQLMKIEDDMKAFEDGADDGEKFLQGHPTPRKLNQHFMGN
jgi:hypothetical protein